MGKEIELRFEVAARDLRKLRSARILKGDSGKPPATENLVSVYFDTPKHKLRTRSVSLRVRHRGGKRLQTIKTEGSNGSIRRGEWEHTIEGDVPDLRKARNTPLADLLSKKLKRTLKPIFETRIRRTNVPVGKNGSRIVVSLDEGEVRAGRKSISVGEVELELKRGKPDELFKLGRLIGELVPAKLELRSKSERGYDLTSPGAVRDQKFALRSHTRTADAFRIICGTLLRHIAAKEPAVRQSDSVGVHKMRVSLRQLRAAISLFSTLLGDDQTVRIKRELKWLTGQLAPARDLDVYVRNEIEPLRRAGPTKRGMKELAVTLSSERAAAFDKAKNAVESARYRFLLLEALRWLEDGDWERRSHDHGDQRIERFATDILARRAKKAIKKAKKLGELDARDRHKLRIAIKKLRYASEFFENLFPGHRRKKRLSVFKDRLKALQDRLGALNDISVQQKLATRIAAGGEGTKPRARAFAAGVASGREQGEIEPLLEAAVQDARKFSHVRPFWLEE
jgi:inorganic triphosphatase YgiF